MVTSCLIYEKLDKFNFGIVNISINITRQIRLHILADYDCRNMHNSEICFYLLLSSYCPQTSYTVALYHKLCDKFNVDITSKALVGTGLVLNLGRPAEKKIS